MLTQTTDISNAIHECISLSLHLYDCRLQAQSPHSKVANGPNKGFVYPAKEKMEVAKKNEKKERTTHPTQSEKECKGKAPKKGARMYTGANSLCHPGGSVQNEV